jgi:hypothetical protein
MASLAQASVADNRASACSVTIASGVRLEQDSTSGKRSGFEHPGAIALVAVVAFLSIALLGFTGNPLLAVAPAAITVAVYLVCLSPFRYPLFGLLFAALVSEITPRMALNDWWRSPLYPVNAFLSDNLSKTIGVEALRFSGAELVFFALVGIALARAFLGLTRSNNQQTATPTILFLCSACALSSVVFLEFLGILRGGDFRQSLWQMRELFWLPILICLFAHALRGSADFRPLAYTVTAATCVKIAIALYFVVAIAWPNRMHPESVTSHNDSVLFVSVVMLWVAAALQNPRPRVLFNSALIVSWVIVGMAINGRRIAFLGLLAVLVLAYTVYRGPIKRTITRAFLFFLPVFLVYLAAASHRPHGVFTPGAMVVSVLQQKDASSATRDIENYNLLQTLKQNKILGSGWGHEYKEVNKAYDISRFFAQYRYIAHNNILWLWSIGGPIGFTLIWCPIVLGFFLARRSYLFARTAMERTAAMACLGVLMSYVLEAWGDMGTQSMNCTLLVAAAIAVSGKLATLTGAWPRGIPLFGAPDVAFRSQAA